MFINPDLHRKIARHIDLGKSRSQGRAKQYKLDEDRKRRPELERQRDSDLGWEL